MGGYYDYTDEFRELITNTEIIIENQESISLSFDILIFVTVLVFVLSICRKIFRVK